MHGQFLLALAATAHLAAALPSPPPTQTKVLGSTKFTIAQDQPKREGRRVAGPIALADALGKFSDVGLQPSPAVVAAAAKALATDDGTVAADPAQFDQLYLSPVQVGDQTLQLDFDSGSSDLWVFSNELPITQQNSHNIYSPSSSAKKLKGQTWKIAYGDGSSASGDVYSETVNIGGTTVSGQAVELASTISDSFASNPGDGLLGLAFSTINTVKPRQQKTFFDNAIANLEQPIFAVDLKKGQPGTYDFGFIDDSKYTGEITYTSVDNSQGFWGFTSTGYKVGSRAAKKANIEAIADTGTSLILLENSIVSAYWAAVDGARNSVTDGGYTFPCDAELPDFTLQIEGFAAVVPGSFINYAPASEQGSCFGGIQSAGNIGTGILGDVFLKAFYVVFSNDGPQLGFANKNLQVIA